MSTESDAEVKFLICLGGKSRLRNFCAIIMESINILNKYTPIGGYAYTTEEGRIKLSLRHSNNLNLDQPNLSSICEYYGGGGHKVAASFSISKEGFDSISHNAPVKLKIPNIDLR